MNKVVKSVVFSVCVILSLVLSSCKTNLSSNVEKIAEEVIGQESLPQLSEHSENYKLKKVLILSRHNVRTPLTTSGSMLSTITPYDWFDWTSSPSELSIKGGVLATEMGQYYRRWAEKEGLFERNYNPRNVDVATDDVRIYANSIQRTLATANYFLTGLFPVSDLKVEHHMRLNKMDPVFNPALTKVNDKIVESAIAQINEMFSDRLSKLQPNYDFIEELVDTKDSTAYKEGKFTGLKVRDSKFVFANNNEPAVTGSLYTGCQISDALIFQHYETSDDVATFGKELSFDDWHTICEVRDAYQDALFTTPVVATNIANPLLREMLSELRNPYRKFTFLCGHDSNIISVLAALTVEDYSLPYTVERKSPIGCEIVISEWTKVGESDKYISVNMVYQSTDQVRGIAMLDEKHPPMVYPLSFVGLEKNEDGYYKRSDVIKRFEEAISKY